jgi:pimeloyl-ACP methyl ester carboxylesterase
MQMPEVDAGVSYPGSFSRIAINQIQDLATLAMLAYKDGAELDKLWIGSRAGGHPTDYAVLKRLKTRPVFIDDPSVGLQAFAAEYDPEMGVEEGKPLQKRGEGAPPKKKLHVVIVRGSKGILDWVINFQLNLIGLGLNAEGVPIPAAVRVHRGFHLQYLSVVAQLGTTIEKFLEIGDVIFAGHSLGAAVSTLLALNYGSKETRVLNVTFGSPMVGNNEFCQQCGQVTRSYRFKNGRDPITKLPILLEELPQPPVQEYSQVGPEIHLGRVDPIPSLPTIFDLPDHDIMKYIENLQEPQQEEDLIGKAKGYIEKIEAEIGRAKSIFFNKFGL